jgi:c-di-GMP-binding flagellar brake protein YcgR
VRAWFTPIHFDNASAEDAFGEITVEQLYSCATLLALSLVQHRAKFGFVPIGQAASELGAALAGSGSADVLAKGKQTLEEALRHIKALAPAGSDQRRDGQAQKAILEEKRQQIRISISAPIHVLPPNTKAPFAAKLENISWGGAAFNVDRCIGEVGDRVQVILPSFRGRRIKVQSEIIRASYDSDGQACVVRFSKLRTADETILQQLLECLTKSGGDDGQRTNARLARRIDIQYDDVNELRARLEDISNGGLSIMLPEPMDVDQSLLVAISTTDEQCELLLRARVVRQQEVYFSELRMFRVSLELGHPTKDIKARVGELIRAIPTIDSAATN